MLSIAAPQPQHDNLALKVGHSPEQRRYTVADRQCHLARNMALSSARINDALGSTRILNPEMKRDFQVLEFRVQDFSIETCMFAAIRPTRVHTRFLGLQDDFTYIDEQYGFDIGDISRKAASSLWTLYRFNHELALTFEQEK